MSRESTKRSARVEARLAPEALAIVKRAARLQGRSVSDFIVAAAQVAARHAIEEADIIRLSADDQARFVEALLNPPPPSAALRRARDKYGQLISDAT